MSFLYDDDIYNEIVKRAFPKVGQQTPAPVNQVLIPKLVRRLDAELSPVATDTFSIGKGDQATGAAPEVGADLKLDDLKLNNLIKFLSDHKIVFSTGGPKDRIVYPQSEFASVAKDQAEYYDKVGEYMVNPTAFANYVQYLQGTLQKKNNPLINAYLKVLIDDTNAQFPDAGLSRSQKPVTLDFADNVELDKVGNSFNPNESAPDGSNSLLVGNLKNKEVFNAWLQQHQAKVILPDEKGTLQEQLYTKAKDLKAAWDAILKSLYSRASRLRELATTQELVKKYDYYKNLLQNLGGSSGSVGSGSTQNVSYQEPNANAMSPIKFNNIIDALPLANDINLFRIETFFDTVKKNYTDPRSLPVITSYMTAAENAINNLKGITNNLNIVQENTVPKDFAYMLKGSTAAYGPAINLLYAIINNTRQVIATINSSFGPVLTEDQRSKLSDQIDFYYGKNRGLLNDLLRDSSQIAR